MKKISNLIYAFLCTSILFTSCDDYLDVNRSDDTVSGVSADLILPVLTFYAAQTIMQNIICIWLRHLPRVAGVRSTQRHIKVDGSFFL